MSDVKSTNPGIPANNTNPLPETSQRTGDDLNREITPKPQADSRDAIQGLSRVPDAKQELKDQLTKFTAFGPEAISQVADSATRQDINDVTSTLEELAEAKWSLINPYKSSQYKEGGFASSNLYYEVTTTKNKSFIARLSADGSGVRFDWIIPLEKFKACDFSKIPDEDYKTDMSRLGAISLEPNPYSSSEEERKTVDYLKNGIAFELAKEGVFAGSEKAKDTETSEPLSWWSDQYNKSLDTLRVGEEITLPGLDKYISPFADADAKHDRRKIIPIFNSMNKPGKLDDGLYGHMLKQLDASGLIDDELGNKILEMAQDPNKVFLTAYSNWRESGDRGGYRWKDGLFRYILEDKNNHYLLQLADRDNSNIGEYMEVYDFNQGCKYEDTSNSHKSWFPAIYSTLKEHGLFPHIPRLTTAEILSNKNGRGDKYIKITKDLDERIKSDAKRYSLMKAAPMLDKELSQGDQDLQETANEKQSTLGAELETEGSGLNLAIKISGQKNETVSLPQFDRSTRLNRDFSKDNHRKVYESLDRLSDEDLSVLSQVIRKTAEVTVPGSVAGLLRELKSKLSSIAPPQRQALVDTSIQIRKALKLGLVNDNTLPSLMPDFPVSAYDEDKVAEKVDLLLEISSRIDKMKEHGIFNNEQALSLKQNMGAQASEEMYLNRQDGLLENIAYLADYAKNNGKSFGPDQVKSLITNKSIIDDQIQSRLITGEINGEPSAALKEKQIGTLDRIAVLGFTREFLEEPDMESIDFHKIERAGKKILENTSGSDSTQTSENNTRLVEESIQPSQNVALNDSPDAPKSISQCLGDVINRGFYGSIVYNPNQISSQDVKNAASKYPNITVIDLSVDLKGKQSGNWRELGRQINDKISRLKLQKGERIFLNLVANGQQNQKSLDDLATEHKVLRGTIDSHQDRSDLSRLIRSTLNDTSVNRIIFAVPLTTDTFHVRSHVGGHLVLEKTGHDYILKNS